MSIISYFTKYRTLMAEIDILSPIPKCVCVNSNCACGNTLKLEKYEDMVKLSQFLMGLGDQYTAVRGQLLMMRPTPTLNNVFSLLLQEESQREFSSSLPPVTENMAMNVRFNKSKMPNVPTTVPKRNTVDPNLVCEFCQNTRHLKDKCFYLHGYPEWQKLYGKPKPKLKKFTNSGFRSAAQVSVKAITGDNMKDQLMTAESSKDNFNLSEAQCQQIVRMLQEKMTPANNWTAASSNSQLYDPNLWILGSGANNHIAFQLQLMHNVKPLNSVSHLPNGETEYITHIGSIKFSSNLTLDEELISMNEREIGDCHERLYKLNSTFLKPHVNNLVQTRSVSNSKYSMSGAISCNKSDTCLWHLRMCHPSIAILQQLQFIDIKPDFSQPCDICHFSKQKMITFTDSTSYSIHIFDLVHIDVRGPYKQSHMPNNFWGNFILTTAHIVNLLPVKHLNYKCPSELLFKTLPKYQHLKVFGCLCYATVTDPNSDKFSHRCIKGVFIGYPFGKKGYKVLDLVTRKCIVSRDVHFVESEFPFKTRTPSPFDKTFLFPIHNDLPPNFETPEHTEHESSFPTTDHDNIDTTTSPHSIPHNDPEIALSNTEIHVRPTRTKQLPSKFKDFVGLPTSLPQYNTHLFHFTSDQAHKQWSLTQLDVANAFLNGDLKETVYMKQAPRDWYNKLSSALLAFGFHMSHSDNSLFTLNKDASFVAVLVYVDDMLITGSSTSLITDVKRFLHSQFQIKDLGPLKYFLGIEVSRSSHGFYLNQRKYTLDLLRDTGLSAAKPSLVHIEQNPSTTKE
ncbi:uncharacterized protein LOC141716901 [Apium graveolens]|uniref:uncharacterized protein LOC141716901 n=1 Tax=Apium graveolens TaxID=4045 RepID=UPI003D79F675